MNGYRILLRRSGVRAAVALCIILIAVALGISAIAAGLGSNVSDLGQLESLALVGAFGATGFALAAQVLSGIASWLHIGITRDALIAYLLTLCAALTLTAGGYLFFVTLALRTRISSLGGEPFSWPIDSFVNGIGVVGTLAFGLVALWSVTRLAQWLGFVAGFNRSRVESVGRVSGIPRRIVPRD